MWGWHSITLRQLLSHTSGIKDYLERPEMTPYDLPPEKIVQIAATFPFNFAPGEKWAYCNTGYVLLGMVIQKVTGKPFSAFLDERVFKPLAMAATQHDEPDSIVLNRAIGYLWLGPGGMRNADMFKYMMSIRAKNLPLRRQRPRIACLRLSATLVYLWRRGLEVEPDGLPGVALRFTP
ncbi:MAG TPA: serine hydrolase domain-containing protein [Candidatus Baltobacteraceae bacterium]|nr:serine hydrolase domain-containing protein [Candidatus Baltobacteraceae bacterium]